MNNFVQMRGLGASTPTQRVGFSLAILGLAGLLWAPAMALGYYGTKLSKKSKLTGALLGAGIGIAISTTSIYAMSND